MGNTRTYVAQQQYVILLPPPRFFRDGLCTVGTSQHQQLTNSLNQCVQASLMKGTSVTSKMLTYRSAFMIPSKIQTVLAQFQLPCHFYHLDHFTRSACYSNFALSFYPPSSNLSKNGKVLFPSLLKNFINKDLLLAEKKVN